MVKQSKQGEGVAVVFDSGIGGLNLLCECARRAPQMHYYYVSDNQNVPYGDRSAEEILRLTLNALDGIEKLRPSALVIACNTVTAQCIDSLRKIFPFPVVGIQPAVKQAAEKGGKCLVLATEATVSSAPFKKLISRFAPADTAAVGCSGLADYIERNIFALPAVLPQGLLPDFSPDSVVLGCTHYAFVKEQIQNRYKCAVYDGIFGTASHFSEIVGMADHFLPRAGIFDHSPHNAFKITFLRGNCDKNACIVKYLFGIETFD